MHDELLDAWDLPHPRTVAQASRGINNESWFVDSDAGQHVLRVYAHDRLEPIRFEHELLAWLAVDGELPFATPLPLATTAGDTVAIAATARGPRPAALFGRLPGDHVNDDDVRSVARGGEALARLDVALARRGRGDTREPSFTGDLTAVHPAVLSLEALDREIGPAAAVLLVRAAEDAGPLRASLPRQITHGDFGFGNLLVVDGRVSALLDFEFSGWDARAADLATGLALVLSKGTGERLWRPFLRAYLGVLRFDPIEIAALPALMRLHEAVAVVWWAGRVREGLSPDSENVRHADRALALDRWLEANGHDLVAEALLAIR